MGFEPAPAAQSLDRAQTGAEGRVVGVQAPAAQPDWGRWLAEIGFLPGERVSVRARSLGGDPLVVRIGTSTFALRRAEAACVQVQALP
jgi:ferrous iron transport protein A